MLAFAVGNMAQAAALNWITFKKALIALLLAKSWECHFPNPTYRFQDLTSSGTNVAFQFCKNDFIYCWKPLQHFKKKRKKKETNMFRSDTCIYFSRGWARLSLAGSVIAQRSPTAAWPRHCLGPATLGRDLAGSCEPGQAEPCVRGVLWRFSPAGYPSVPGNGQNNSWESHLFLSKRHHALFHRKHLS